MARRSAHFDARVDPRLIRAIEANQLPGYDVEMISGYRGKTPKNPRSRHGKGAALDVSLIDQKTGKAVPNYQDAEAFKTYQQYANQVYRWAQQNDPELAAQLAWGGYFSGGPGKYGALDLMHFDTGGMQAGGDWEAGLYPQQAKIWGLDPGGGLGAATTAQLDAMRGPQGPVEAAGGGAGNEAGGPVPTTVQHPPNPTVGTGDLPPAMETPVANADKNPWSILGKGLAKAGAAMTGNKGFDYNVPAQPGPARVDVGAAPIIDPQAAEMKRQQLAMVMARLNSGSLF